MKNRKFIFMILSVLITTTILSGCTFIDNMAVKMNLRNEKFDYIKENTVDKIIIQNVRDSGFRFIVSDSQAINDIYKSLAKSKIEKEKTILDPDYIFEIWMGDEVKKYNYVVGSDSNGVGNFYDDEFNFLVPKNLENTIMQNLSFIRKPRDFQYIYYQSILKVVEAKKNDIGNSKVGIDISGDTDCLKYVFSIQLEEFKKNLKKVLPNADIVDNNSKDFDVIITVKNRGFSSKMFKTLISVENKNDNSLEKYYISSEYNLKTWDINVSEKNQKPQDW
ncbi:MAG: hypothetical protein E7207_03005 [Clostridium butyricum]|nr:hypothetical protein [Clostridium butyricum]